MTTSNKTISLVMPTYNRDYIINLAIKSIVQQQSYSSKIELIIGDDGNDSTEEIVAQYKNTNIKIIYKQFERIALSDKINKLVELSTGDYYGIIGSDDIQSPIKFQLLKNPYLIIRMQKYLDNKNLFIMILYMGNLLFGLKIKILIFLKLVHLLL